MDILLSTLSELNKNKLYTAKPILIFFSVNTLSLTGLYRKIKYSLSIVFISLYSNQLI